MSGKLPIKKERKTASYIYGDETGVERFRIDRYECEGEGKPTKRFVCSYVENGRRVYKAPPVTYPYRIDSIIQTPIDEYVFVVEGEKCVDALRLVGLNATTAPFGAGADKFKPEWAKYFAGRPVVIMPDNDAPGRAHMDAVSKLLLPVAQSLTQVTFESFGPKADVADFLAAGGTARALRLLIGQCEGNISRSNEASQSEKGDAFEPPEDRTKEIEEIEDLKGVEWVPFPLDSLPAAMASYIDHASKALRCDPAYFVLPSLITLSACAGTKFQIRLKPTWTEPAVLWGCLVADSGTMKSPATYFATACVHEIEDLLREDEEKEYEDWRIEHHHWERLRGKSRDGDDDSPPPEEPIPPTSKRLIVQDITVESLTELLEGNPRGLFLLRDELAGWIGSFSKYRDGKSAGSDVPFWLEVYNNASYRKDRKGGDRRSIYIPRTFVSVFGAIQPSTFAEIFSKELFGSGLVARILMTMPPKTPKLWTEATIPDEVAITYLRLLKWVYFVPPDLDAKSRIRPIEFGFSPEGKKAWVEFYNYWGERQWKSEGDQAAALAKLEGVCARLCLLFAVWDAAELGLQKIEVSEVHVSRAFKVTEWFTHEASRIYRIVKGCPDATNLAKTIDHIDRLGGAVSPRDLLRSNPRRYGNAENAQSTLDQLVRSGVGTWETRVPSEKGGRPTKQFCLADKYRKTMSSTQNGGSK